ncbi:MAG: 50S ribosomal protein L21 [Defluviitaleaceae bacterium]|nr:50S ribosomal protein L21 [Defluviitaleaceae bacterium]
MYAIIQTGGKQYKVQVGDIIKIEKLDVEPGTSYVFDNVIAISNDGDFVVGTPTVGGATVDATVMAQEKAKKVIVYKFKAKKGYHKKKGHRQPYTQLKIDGINR